MNNSRPTWCPDQKCIARGSIEDVVCGGICDGGAPMFRICTVTAAGTPYSLDKLKPEEVVELQRLLARLHTGPMSHQMEERKL